MTITSQWEQRRKGIQQIHMQETHDYMSLIKLMPPDVVQKFSGYPVCEQTWILMLDYIAEQEALLECQRI